MIWSYDMMQSLKNVNWLPYPVGLAKLLLRFPLLAFRLGLGDLLNAIHLMVLTTRGRKSGQARHTMIEFRRHGSKIYVISAWGEKPHWYQNMLTDPLATVQLGRQSYSVLADPVTDPAEALRAISLFRRVAPARYDVVLGRVIEEDVNAQTLPELSRQFTVMRLNIIPDAPTLPGVAVDLLWLWPVMGVVLFAAFTFVGISRARRAGQEESG